MARILAAPHTAERRAVPGVRRPPVVIVGRNARPGIVVSITINNNGGTK